MLTLCDSILFIETPQWGGYKLYIFNVLYKITDSCGEKRLNKLNDTINAYRSIRDDVNKNVRGMHIFQIEFLTDIIYSIPITVVSKPFLGNYFIYFCLCCQSLPTMYGL